MSNLVDHAKRELAIIGYHVEPPFIEGDMNDTMSKGLLELIQKFADQGHSGHSGEYATQILSKLLRFENLTQLTDDPEEWYCHEGGGPGFGDLWQNKRNGAAFSEDGGKTYTLLEDRDTVITSVSKASILAAKEKSE